MGRDHIRAVVLLAALPLAMVGLAACGDSGPSKHAVISARAVVATCGDSFSPTPAMRQAILRQEYVDIGPLTFVALRQQAAAETVAARSLKVMVIATPAASVTVTIDARDRSRSGFLLLPATDVDPLPPDAKPRFQIRACTGGLLSRRSLAYEMTWATASPGCVHFTVAEAGGATRRAAIPFGAGKRC